MNVNSSSIDDPIRSAPRNPAGSSIHASGSNLSRHANIPQRPPTNASSAGVFRRDGAALNEGPRVGHGHVSGRDSRKSMPSTDSSHMPFVAFYMSRGDANGGDMDHSHSNYAGFAEQSGRQARIYDQATALSSSYDSWRTEDSGRKPQSGKVYVLAKAVS